MEKDTTTSLHNSAGKTLTIFAIIFSIIALLISFIPFFGSISIIIGAIGIILSIIAIVKKSKVNLKKHWSIVALVLSVIAGSLGVFNYLNHKNAVDVLLGIPGARSNALIVPEDSPIREAVERREGYSEKEINDRKERVAKRKAEESKKNQQVEKEEEQKSNDITDDPFVTKISRDAPLNFYYYSIVDNLRVRSSPETNSEVLYKIHFGEQVEYVGEKSDQKEVITIAGKERDDYWYKVKAFPGERKHGWVYGGALINASQEYVEEATGLIMPINFIYPDSLERILGRRPYGGYNYSGLVKFKKGSKDEPIFHGRFHFEGFAEQSFYNIPGHGEAENIGGNFINGKLQGEYKEVIGLFETGITLKIDYKNGVCQSYKMISNQEGEISESTSNSPQDCSVDFIESQLKEIN